MTISISINDLGSKFTADDIIGGPGKLQEDNAVIKAQDGKFYWFFDQYSPGNFDVYCVRSDFADFHAYTNLGKVITVANKRVMSCVYDSVREEYILYLADRSANYDTYAYYIAAADFPDGAAWTSAGIVLAKGAGGTWDETAAAISVAWQEGSTYKILYHSRTVGNRGYGLATSSDPRAVFTKDAGNPLFYEKDLNILWSEFGGLFELRGIYPYDGGYLVFAEGLVIGSYWKTGCIYLDGDLKPVYECLKSPCIEDTDQSCSDPNTVLVDGGTIYLYFDKTKAGTANEVYYSHVGEVTVSGGTPNYNFPVGYSKRKYRGFISDDVVRFNCNKELLGQVAAGADVNGEVHDLVCQADFDDFRVAEVANNNFQSEFHKSFVAATSSIKLFRLKKIYSSILTGDAAAAQKDVAITDASEFNPNNWVVIARDNGTDELIQIDSIVGNTITMKTNLVNAYTVADNARVMLAYYIYYDNAAEIDNSDADSTFPFYDAFPGAAIDTNKWEGSTGNASVAGGIMTFAATAAAWVTMNSKTDIPRSARFIFYARITQPQANWWFNLGAFVWATDGVYFGHSDPTTEKIYAEKADVKGSALSDFHMDTTWHEYRIEWSPGDASFFEDGVECANSPLAANIPTVDLPALVSCYGNGQTIEIDWFMVCNCLDPVGSGFGAEEEATWLGKIAGVSAPATVAGVLAANIASVKGVA